MGFFCVNTFSLSNYLVIIILLIITSGFLHKQRLVSGIGLKLKCTEMSKINQFELLNMSHLVSVVKFKKDTQQEL